MIRLIFLFIFWASILIGQSTNCRLNKVNIAQFLEFGLNNVDTNKRPFETNCTRANGDTLTFYLYDNDIDIKDGSIFLLKNKTVAIYTKNQPKLASLILWQPIINEDNYRVNFTRNCGGGEISGYLNLYCDGKGFEFHNMSFVTSID